MPSPPPPLTWLAPGQDFPPPTQAWDERSPAPGLLAAGGALDIESLRAAYGHGIFPWYSEGQPILWWSPNPRMVLDVSEFRLHPSLRKTLLRFRRSSSCEIRIDSAFHQVIQACATSRRNGQNGTWILPDMVTAYCHLHQAGVAHSVETWVDGTLVGGLYCVALGRFVFGESMFSCASDASKIALAALIGFCREHGIRSIDCQQNTRHLASLGAREISRELFLAQVKKDIVQAGPSWEFESRQWNQVLPDLATAS
jgi:leucyl/phenylalanyl-tRNA---protein transferase